MRDLTVHLEKYFELARSFFESGDLPLAAFFGLTTVEEAAKWMIVGGKSSESHKEIKKQALDHGTKYFDAAVNLFNSTPDDEDLPPDVSHALWDIFQPERARRLRSDCLYMRFDSNGRFTIPDRLVDRRDAGLVVYGAGVALGALTLYSYDIDKSWSRDMFNLAEEFRDRANILASHYGSN